MVVVCVLHEQPAITQVPLELRELLKIDVMFRCGERAEAITQGPSFAALGILFAECIFHPITYPPWSGEFEFAFLDLGS